MTKAELLAAIAAAPDNATIYIHTGDGILKSTITAFLHDDKDIVLELKDEEE